MKILLVCGVALAILLGATASTAAEDSDSSDRRGRRGPPKVALEACASATQGDSCSFTGRRGDTLSGTCELKRAEALVCFPEGGPPKRRQTSGEQTE